MDILLADADESDLAWIESAVRTCPASMAEFGGFYGQASTRVPPLLGNDRRFLLVRETGRRLGFVDVDADRTEPDAWNLTYFVIPPERRRGVGLRTLELVAATYPSSCLLAAIQPSNLASLGLARRAGFVESGRSEWGEIRLRRTGRPDAAV